MQQLHSGRTRNHRLHGAKSPGAKSALPGCAWRRLQGTGNKTTQVTPTVALRATVFIVAWPCLVAPTSGRSQGSRTDFWASPTSPVFALAGELGTKQSRAPGFSTT